MAISLLAHYFIVPSNASEIFDPSQTCSTPPLSCWDGFNKPHYKCVKYDKDTEIRPGVIIKAGSSNCYKSVYFNLDATAFHMLGLFLVWGIVTFKAFEQIVVGLLKDNIRKVFVLNILSALPTMWYSFSVLIHYLNDSTTRKDKEQKLVYVEVKKNAKEIETQTTADIQEYYSILRKLISEINPTPEDDSHAHESERIVKDKEKSMCDTEMDTVTELPRNWNIEIDQELDMLSEAHAFKKTRWIYEAHQKQIKSIRHNILKII
ncbi:hypothetical protein HDV01_001366 [Terramyces sp. JEL0728]|nr:hypothetical protein HDV01_001366 [Terramyces sp. JEL0728]